MKIHIFDVEHGECNIVETPSGESILIGAGHNSTTNWRPSTWFRERNLKPSWVVMSNLDRDHLSDLPSFEPNLRPTVIKRNNYLQPNWVRNLKIQESGEVHESVETALDWMENVFTGQPIQPNFGMETSFFTHSPAVFQDTNNLSVVTYLRYNNIGIMFPGDLECAGWKEFLKDPTFVQCLLNTNVLIASHHGRVGGYCAEMFQFCNPQVVIISDKNIVHDTQDHNLYDKHCKGIAIAGQQRRVLTTRNDGKMTIDIPPTGQAMLYINQNYMTQGSRTV